MTDREHVILPGAPSSRLAEQGGEFGQNFGESR